MHWQTLAWPFRPTPLFAALAYVLVAFAFTAWASMNFWVGVLVVTMGAPVWYAVLGGLSVYARRILTQAAQGLFEEPIDSETDINPFQSGQALQMGLAHLTAFLIFYYNGPDLGWLLLGPAFLFTLMWTGIVLDDSLFRYFRPAEGGLLLSGLGIYIPLAMLLIAGSTGYLHHTLLYDSSFLNILLSPFVFLFANLLYGHLLYHRRHQLNLHTVKSPERTLAAEAAARQRLLDKLFHDVHTHANAGSWNDAVRLIEAHVAEDPVTRDPLMHQRLLDYQNDRLYLEHAVRYLGRLCERGEQRKAWALMKECLHKDARFRPPDDATLFAMTRAAGLEDAGLVNTLLEDFDTAYPDSPLIPDARFRRARVCIEILRDGETGMALLGSIARDYPAFASSEPYQRYRRRLKPA